MFALVRAILILSRCQKKAVFQLRDFPPKNTTPKNSIMKNRLLICLGFISLALGCKSPKTEVTAEVTDAETSTRTYPEMQQQVMQTRAIEAIIWGMPAVNLDFMYQTMLRETKGKENQMLYWSRLLDWKTQTLTPNTDVIYFTPYFNTKEVGPMVLEIPPADSGAIVGTIWMPGRCHSKISARQAQTKVRAGSTSLFARP